jgi:hypothetical protein
MKFNDERHHERKSEWFGKRGIHLHQGVFERPISNGAQWYISTDCFATVFQDQVKQDAETTAALLLANIEVFHQNNPEVLEVNLNCDNASNYKCSKFVSLLLGINSLLTGIKIRYLKFSKAEAGKSICDRYGGVQKRFALKSVSSGYNITCGYELAGAITRNGGIANVTTLLGTASVLEDEGGEHGENVETATILEDAEGERNEDVEAELKDDNLSIPNIKAYYSFELREGEVLVKKH